ncbi:hypothetical protein K9M48_01985 [Candidatus Gracilibacteria bacterium]|nr:hypothetical protein [Candidatus Gracilibacteria bacterium]
MDELINQENINDIDNQYQEQLNLKKDLQKIGQNKISLKMHLKEFIETKKENPEDLLKDL